MESLDFKNIYWNYYLQIENDFFATTPYCAIDESNNNSFSVKYLQLHLSIWYYVKKKYKLNLNF